MISFEEAIKKAKELKPSTDSCSEMSNAYIFACKDDENYEGGSDHTPCVIIKETGEAVNMPTYIAEYGYGEEIRDREVI